MAITISKHFEVVAVQYVKRLAEEEMIGELARGIRKQSRRIAENIVENMEINIVLKDIPNVDKKTLALLVKNKKI
jgi:archaellum component FlaG (FlaF/FlaG flagellin family)